MAMRSQRAENIEEERGGREELWQGAAMEFIGREGEKRHRGRGREEVDVINGGAEEKKLPPARRGKCRGKGKSRGGEEESPGCAVMGVAAGCARAVRTRVAITTSRDTLTPFAS